MTQLLFSYGTLRQRDVQRRIFGRELDGHPDAIVGFDLQYVTITDPDVISASGSDRHPILHPSDDGNAAVDGTVFTVSDSDLLAADEYEVGDYQRVSVPLRTGDHAWVYVHATRSAEALADKDSRPVIRIVAAVIVDTEGRVLVVRKRGTTAYMQPGGKFMAGETAAAALRREIAEELGVVVEASDLRPLGRHVADAANEPGHLVEADLFMVSLPGAPRAAAEIDEIAWVDPAAPGDIELAPLTRGAVFAALRH